MNATKPPPVLAVVALFISGLMAGSLQRGEAEEILYEQSIPAEPLPIILPANFGGRLIPMALDTGAGRNVVDTALQSRLHDFIEETKATAIGGELKVKSWKSPPMSIGGWKLPPSSVMPFDLAAMRSVLGCDIRGIVGREALQGGALEVNFDRKRLRVLRGYQPAAAVTPLQPGETLTGWKFAPMIDGDDGSAGVRLEVDGSVVQVEIDTGNNCFISLRTETFEKLVASGAIAPVPDSDNSVDTTLAGSFRSHQGRFTRGKFLGVDLAGATVADGRNVDLVGLSFLVQLNFVYDLSAHRFYFERRHGEPAIDPWRMMGACFIYTGGRCHVLGTTIGPARQAGMQSDDTIFRLGRLEGKQLNVYSLYQLCETCAGKTIAVEYSRTGKKGTFKAELKLPEKMFTYPANQ